MRKQSHYVIVGFALAFVLVLSVLPAVGNRVYATSNPFSPVLYTNCNYIAYGVPSPSQPDLYGSCAYNHYDSACQSSTSHYSGTTDQSSAEISSGNVQYTCGIVSSGGYQASNSAQAQSNALTHDSSVDISGTNTGEAAAVSGFWDSLTVTGTCPLSSDPSNLAPCIEISWSLQGSGTSSSSPDCFCDSPANVGLSVFAGSVTMQEGPQVPDTVNGPYQAPNCFAQAAGSGNCATSGSFDESGSVPFPFYLINSGDTIFWGAYLAAYGEGSFSLSASDPTVLTNLAPCTPTSGSNCVTFSPTSSQVANQPANGVPEFTQPGIFVAAIGVAALFVLRTKLPALRKGIAPMNRSL